MNQQTIIDASFMIISKEGLSNFSLGRLAKELGCTKSSIYNYFSSKDEIFNSVFTYYALRLSSTLDENCSNEKLYRKFVEYGLKNIEEFTFYFFHSRHYDFNEDTLKVIEEFGVKIRKLLLGLAEDLGADITNETILFGLLLGPMFSVIMQQKKNKKAVNLTNDELDFLVDSMLRSIRKENV